MVDLCRDGASGLHSALNEHYDLIILDVMLPELNGWQVLQTLRSKDLHAGFVL